MDCGILGVPGDTVAVHVKEELKPDQESVSRYIQSALDQDLRFKSVTLNHVQ